MAPVLLHAAAFDRDISQVALLEPYSSYRSIVMCPDYKADFLYSTVPASIGVYDLPDLAASLAPRKLLLAGVTDGAGRSNDPVEVNRDLSVIEAVYQRYAPKQLQIVPAGDARALMESLKSWMGN